jgi:uncharacterized protein YdeI (YjbR/CyaY-like superfamily)
MDEIIEFKTAKAWEKWLAKNHSISNGIWMRMFKKNSGVVSLKGPEALDVALCYGWITGQARSHDDISVLWRFCPRRPKSIWSKVNTLHAERLIKEGRMKPAGFRQIEEARRDGRWGRAYSPQRTATVPRDFIRELNKNERAKAFFRTLNRTNTYAIIFRLENTKNKNRRKAKISTIIEMLANREKFH